jgi:glycosyltransferase involved in cell wall biosynthesis
VSAFETVTRPERPTASVIVPALDEEETLPAFYERVVPILDGLFSQWNLIFVDDGSTDRTFHMLREMRERDPRVQAVRLSRNFGSHVAIAAGLDHADGDVAVILAADLQDPPETIADFLTAWHQGSDIVWGARESRDDPLGRRIFARVFYGLVRRYALPGIPSTGTGSFTLIDRSVVEAFRQFEEHNRMTFGIISWSGFAQTEVAYRRAPRHAGRSKWSLPQLVKAAIDTFVAFSYAPLRFISYFGLIVSMLSFAFGVYVVIDYELNGTALRGWPSLMAGILFFGGVQLLTLGVVAEYIWRISEESKRRPLYLVRERLGVRAE